MYSSSLTPDHLSSSSLGLLQHIGVFPPWRAQTGHNTPDALSHMLNRGKKLLPSTCWLLSCKCTAECCYFSFHGLLYQDPPTAFSAKMLSVLLAPRLYCCMVNYSNLSVRLSIYPCWISWSFYQIICPVCQGSPAIFPSPLHFPGHYYRHENGASSSCNPWETSVVFGWILHHWSQSSDLGSTHPSLWW